METQKALADRLLPITRPMKTKASNIAIFPPSNDDYIQKPPI